MGGPAERAQIPPALLEEVAGFGTATLHEAAGRIGALPGAIAPLDRAMKLWGTALPVFAPAGDNLALHRAIALARPGDVLVVDHGGTLLYGPFGDILALAARMRGIAGLVIDGAVRDSESLIAMGFPVFSRGCSIEGTIKRDAGTVGEPVRMGAVTVHHGDAVIGDADGVVILPSVRLAAIRDAAIARLAAEADMKERIAQGELTLDLLGLRALLP
jgi:4-hydroxy-4-methyl-2-oxoglutarate aldolase